MLFDPRVESAKEFVKTTDHAECKKVVADLLTEYFDTLSNYLESEAMPPILADDPRRFA